MRAFRCDYASLQCSASIGSRMQCQDDKYRARYDFRLYLVKVFQGHRGDLPDAAYLYLNSIL